MNIDNLMIPDQPLFIYGNWSAYDELSDGIELTEELAMRQLREVLRMREHGVRFDAYLMDAFWFAPDGGYREWRKPHWPDGPDRWLNACAEAGLLPGLWFTANTLCHLNPTPRWADSVDKNGWGMCLFEGGFREDFADILDHWYARGIRLFKFDFAEFAAVPAGREDPMAREKNIAAFRSLLAAFRFKHPDAILMAFNGFEEFECMNRTDRPLQPCFSPAWLEVFDSIYCGDPRPADVPDVDFWRSVDLYSDHMTRVFEQCGLALDRIDNCGFMAGPTGTCYWRGKAGWQRMLLLSLARGGRIHVAYGDLSQFSNEDAHWWAAAQALYSTAMTQGNTASWGGLPGQAECYGWMSQRPDGRVLTIVNPKLGPASFPVPEGMKIATYEPGFVPELRDGEITLAAGQLAVLTSGTIVVSFSLDGAERVVATVVEEPLSTRAADGATAFGFGPLAAGHATLIVWQTDTDGDSIRPYPAPDQKWMFSAEIDSGGETIALPTQPERVVWSGMSWAAFPLPCEVIGRQFRASVKTAFDGEARLRAQVVVRR